MNKYNFEKIAEISVNTDTDFQELKVNVINIDNLYFMVNIRGDVDKSKVVDLISFLKENKKRVSVATDDVSYLSDIHDSILLLRCNNPDYINHLEDIMKSFNFVFLRYQPCDFKNFYEKYEEIQKINSLYPSISYCLDLNEVSDTEEALNWIRRLPEALQKKILIYGIGKCFIRNEDLFKLSVKGLLDIDKLVTDSEVKDLSPVIQIRNQAKSKICSDCVRTSECLGVPKTSETINSLAGTYEPLDKDYTAVSDFFLSNMDYVDTRVLKVSPLSPEGSWGNESFKSLQRRRLERNFEGPNFYYIYDFSKSFYFMRPLEEVPLWREDPRGLPSLNWQFIGKDIPELRWKQKCDLLIPENGFTVACKIKFTDAWNSDLQDSLDRFTFENLKSIILENGGESDKLVQQGNDLLYNGKKFAGKEWNFMRNIGYIENTVITCSYIKEKEWFDKLFHWAGEKQITGISDELPNITKEFLISEINRRVDNFFHKRND